MFAITYCSAVVLWFLVVMQPGRRLLLTGTPLQNNLTELLSLLHFTMPDIFSPTQECVRRLFSAVGKVCMDICPQDTCRDNYGLSPLLWLFRMFCGGIATTAGMWNNCWFLVFFRWSRLIQISAEVTFVFHASATWWMVFECLIFTCLCSYQSSFLRVSLAFSAWWGSGRCWLGQWWCGQDRPHSPSHHAAICLETPQGWCESVAGRSSRAAVSEYFVTLGFVSTCLCWGCPAVACFVFLSVSKVEVLWILS